MWATQPSHPYRCSMGVMFQFVSVRCAFNMHSLLFRMISYILCHTVLQWLRVWRWQESADCGCMWAPSKKSQLLSAADSLLTCLQFSGQFPKRPLVNLITLCTVVQKCGTFFFLSVQVLLWFNFLCRISGEIMGNKQELLAMHCQYVYTPYFVTLTYFVT